MKNFRILFLTMMMFLPMAQLNAAPDQKHISLDGAWQLSYWKQPAKPVTSPDGIAAICENTINATVPGNVELDLLAAGIIPDPMIGGNVNDLRKWEGYQWCYTRTFDAPALAEGQRLQLHFGGIDCLADVWVNGVHVGTAENMLIEHDFDITDAVRTGGGNLLSVIIRSAVLEGQNHLLGAYTIGNSPSEESIFTRKAPHMFGWDILPREVSAGLWRSVELQVVDPVHFRNVHYFVATLDTLTRDVLLYIDAQITMPFEKFDKAKTVYTISRNGKVAFRQEKPVLAPAYRLKAELHDVDLWWPRGLGDPALYDAKIEIVDEDGTVLATDQRRIGLRTVALDRNEINLPDAPGRFRFIVNGEPVFIHGTNWVPMDALHSRDDSHLDKMIEMAVDINCNMIRCWGGNVYEDHRFFDLCDENGIMVWQDFAMGCTFYPQRPEFGAKVRDEIEFIVCKLRNHPSLVLWAGNNEDDVALRHWSMKYFNLDPNRDLITRHVIPSVLFEFEPARPYLPSSPYISQQVYDMGGDQKLFPENHLWGPRGYYKDSFYLAADCDFVSEIGYHGCPNIESLKKMFTPANVYPWEKDREWNDEWLTKSVRKYPAIGKDYYRNNLMINQINLLFGDVPTDLEQFSFASQIVQAEAMKYFVEMWRGFKPNKGGIIWWNLRDGWPVVSDAIVDYYYSKKMAYYFIRNAQKDVCAFIGDARDGGHPLRMVNDTRCVVEGPIKVTDMATGKVIFNGMYKIPANGAVTVATLPEVTGQGIWKIEYESGGVQLGNHYLYGQPPFNMKEYRKLLKKTGLYEF